MKHLRKAFSNHRLIRSYPDGPQDTLSTPNTGDVPGMPSGVSSAHTPNWQRRKPCFPSEPTETTPGFITLWDETDRKNTRK